MIEKEKNVEIFRALPVPTALINIDDPAFTIVAVNDAFKKVSSRQGKDIVGKSFSDAYQNSCENHKFSDFQVVLSSFRKALETEQIHKIPKIRYDITTDKGKPQLTYWEFTVAPYYNNEDCLAYLLCTASDITENVLIEEQKDIILNHTEGSFILTNENLEILLCNDQFVQNYKEIFGIEVQKGISILEYALPERRKEIEKIYEHVLSGETIEIELPVPIPGGDYRYFNVLYKPAKRSNGDIFGAFISLREITSEKEAKQSLEEKEARFRSLVEQGGDVVVILDSKGDPKYITPSVEPVFGYKPEEAQNLNVTDVTHPEDFHLVEKALREAMENPGKDVKVPPVRMQQRDRTWRWYETSITDLRHEPSVAGIVDNIRDVHEQVLTEKLLERSKEKYESLVRSVEGVIWEAKADTYEFTYISPQSEYLFGYSAEEWINNSDFWENNIHPEDRQESVAYCQNQTKKGLNHDFEYRFKKASGEYIWVRDVVTVITKNGKPDLLRGLMIDINEQKRLINLMEETYQIAKIGNWELDLKQEKLFWSPFIKELHDVPPDYEPDLNTAIEFYEKGKSRKEIEKAVENAIEHNESFDVELTIITAKGNKKWIRAVGTPEQANGECIRIFGSTQDITDRKIAEEKLKKAEQKYRNVVEHSTNMFYTHGVDGVLNYVSPQSNYFLGYEPEEAKKRWTEFITDHPINQKGVAITQKAIETGETQPPYELQLRTGKDEIIWVEVNEAPLVVNGETVSIVGSLTDITERKKYEEKLQNSLERYHYVSKATRDAIYDWDAEKNTIHWGDGLYSLFGYKPSDIDASVNRWIDLIHPDDVEEVREALKFTLKDASMNHWAYEYRLKKANGDYAHVRENGYIKRNEDGWATRMIGAIQDITEEVFSKQEIQASLSEKETLLSEIHHRVKNNLAVVSGMIQLQAYDTENADLQAKLFDSVVRIKTMATVHELLYQSQSFSKLEFSDTLQKLVENISDTLRSNTYIDTTIDCEPIKLNINQAIPASLIVNEVITNIYKHAFKGREKGNVAFKLDKKNELINIQIKDDGVGFPEGFDVDVNTSLGFHLIRVLSDQIDATYKYENGTSGTLFELSFRKHNNKGIGNRHLK
ncbi:MAG: PAS domain S-box protein [Gracilimonas sp.]|uniref:PAS domain S-box protein n=1 Tax=Gracilimonas TaxID=649462 RepID=UPI001AFD1A00|nr:PAS domain S-box protein [Gracilimonas sp.]MBO6586509.1 PAS domain S-box protein [Gracilimonas sp.]MBO6615166.1 PAS domain S-box protein [Gracilimonas sp.]